MKLLKPKYDVVFQALFQGNKENITGSFISDILEREVEIIDLKKTIGIIITNYEIEELKGIEELNTKWMIADQKGRKILTEDLELRIIEIPKAKRILETEGNNRIAQWLAFIDNPNDKGVKKIMEENEEVKKAESVLHEMSEDEKLQRLAELREKWELDERSARIASEDIGFARGKAEGKVEGESISKKNMAKKMKDMKMKIDQIIEITGLTREEIEKL